jgi:hypothetical protein
MILKCWRLMSCIHRFAYIALQYLFFFSGSTAPWGPRPPHFSRLHDHTFYRHTTLGRTPLDEGPARHRDLYLTTHNTHKRPNIHALGGIRTHNPSKRAAVHPRLRPRGHSDRLTVSIVSVYSFLYRRTVFPHLVEHTWLTILVESQAEIQNALI